MPSFQDFGKATANCALSSESLSKSKVLISGPFDNSVCSMSAHPFVEFGYIATEGTQIVSLPAIFTALTVPPPSSALITPVPFVLRSIPTFESPPDAVIDGLFPVAAFTKVTSLTAELVAVIKATSFPLVSKIEVPILGDVNVLFVKVCVPARVTVPAGKV